MKVKVEKATQLFLTSDDLVYEVELFKADIETELFECSNFNELWQSFSAKPIIEKAIKEIAEILIRC